jgi:acylaminoacyl-peptidase
MRALAGTDLPGGLPPRLERRGGARLGVQTHRLCRGRRYPAVYLIHTAVEIARTDGWSYRWNPQIHRRRLCGGDGQFHGSPGFGQPPTPSTTTGATGRWRICRRAGSPLASNAFIDGDRACALRGSYGGYMVNLIASKWNGPWRCLVNHAGCSVGQLMNAMDIPPSSPSSAAVERRTSTVTSARTLGWRLDQTHAGPARLARFPGAGGAGAGDLLGPQRRGIDRFVHVPDENHWVLKPRNWVDWQQGLDWTAGHTGPAPRLNAFRLPARCYATP